MNVMMEVENTQPMFVFVFVFLDFKTRPSGENSRIIITLAHIYQLALYKVCVRGGGGGGGGWGGGFNFKN
jgi:hypothetical protein